MNAQETIKYLYEHGHIPSHDNYSVIQGALTAMLEALEFILESRNGHRAGKAFDKDKLNEVLEHAVAVAKGETQ